MSNQGGREPENDVPGAPDGKPHSSSSSSSSASAAIPSGPRPALPLLLWGILLAVFAGVGVGVVVYTRHQRAEEEAARRTVTGESAAYTLETSPVWTKLPKAQFEAQGAQIDLVLGREEPVGAVFVVAEPMEDVLASPEALFDASLAVMKEGNPQMITGPDEALPQDPANGVMQRIDLPTPAGTMRGFVGTLLTPRYLFRVVAMVDEKAFAAREAEVRQIVASFKPPADSAPLAGSFQEARSAPTKLVRKGPAPQVNEDAPLPEGVTKVEVPSGALTLKGLWVAPRGPGAAAVAGGGKVPALVFLHAGFGLGNDDLEVPALFADAGFAVLAPTTRGENGNAGAFELFRGEVDDVVAAARWTAARPEVDPQRIAVFGDRTGGALAGLAALVPDAPIRWAGSAGGAYEEDVFEAWHKRGWVPFDPKDRAECRARVLGPFLGELKRPFFVYWGDQDEEVAVSARRLGERARRLGVKQVVVERVTGTAKTALLPAARRFLAAVQGP